MTIDKKREVLRMNDLYKRLYGDLSNEPHHLECKQHMVRYPCPKCGGYNYENTGELMALYEMVLGW